MGIGNADGGFRLLKNKYNGIFVKKPGIPGFFIIFYTRPEEFHFSLSRIF